MFEYASFVTRNPGYVIKHAREQYAVRKAILAHRKNNPVCAATGLTNRLEVHHLLPVSVRPDLAADSTNLITLHKHAHLIIGHGGNYKSYVTNVKEVCASIKIQRTQPG